MNMKKLIPALAGILVLALLAWWAYQKNDTKSTLNIKDIAFAVEDTSAIDKIFVAYKDGTPSALFTRNTDGSGWTINEKFKVRSSRMRIIMETLVGVKVRRPISKAEHDQVIKTLATDGIKIEVYQKGQLVRTFFLGPENPQSDSNYAILDNSDNPYLVHLPGHNGIIDVRFRIDETEWRDNQIFSSNYFDITEVKVEYYQDPENNYHITRGPEGYAVNGSTDIDTSFVLNYLGKFKSVYAETIYKPDYYESFLDSLQGVGATGKLVLVDKNQKNSNTLEFFMNPENENVFFATDKRIGGLIRIQHESFKGLLYIKKGFFKAGSKVP